MIRVTRHLQFTNAAQAGELRKTLFNGVEHLVVPVVALVQGVVLPAGADGPELVLASELGFAPQGWNGRPVLPEHPALDQSRQSANDPQILEAEQFGVLFNASVAADKLVMEAWLDSARAGELGGDAQRVLERCLAGEMVEVSVGAFVELEDTPGEYEGQAYRYVWRNIVPDHLAMLPEGTPGACSNKMGCGAPRMAQAREEHMEPKPERKKLRDRLLSAMRVIGLAATGADDEMSDRDLRSALDDALRAVEPGYLGIEAVYPTDLAIVFAVAPEDRILLVRRDYSVDAGGKATLGEKREEVQPITRYEPVSASASTCPCGAGTKQPTEAGEGADVMKEKKERIRALIACPKTPFTDADEAVLTQLADERLTALEAHFAAQPEPKVLAAEPKTPVVEPPKPKTEEEYLAEAPESIRQLVARQKQADVEKRTALLAGLKGEQTVYADAELEKMPLDELGKLARLVGASAPVDFGGNGAPRDENVVPVPADLTAKIKTLRSGK